MDSYDTGRLIYLVLLGSVIAAYFFVSNRDRLGQAARQAVLAHQSAQLVVAQSQCLGGPALVVPVLSQCLA